MIKALLIKGVEDTLKYLDNDVKMLNEVFEELEIDVQTTSGQKFPVLQDLCTIIDQLGSTDTLIIYYTGHGVIRNGKINFKLGKDNSIADYLSVNELLENTSNARTANIVLIFDCCYATATQAAWKDYASDKHILFLPSAKLEAVEELEEYKASFFTYCIYDSLKSNLLNKKDKILLEDLYECTKEKAIQYNREKATTMPVPELFGARSKSIVIGYSQRRDETEYNEEKIKEYLNSFIHCIEKCDRTCNESYNWCSTIFDADANIYQYVIPSVREFLSNSGKENLIKLNAFFDQWFKKEGTYLALLGDMGVGKTTACIYLFYYLAKKYEVGEYNYVPVYLSLRDLNERMSKEKTIYSLIKVLMSSIFTIEEISILCREKRIVLILDGFDEISGDSSSSAILHNYNKLRSFMRFNCKTVLTCRTHYFSEQDQLEEVLTRKIQGTDFSKILLNDEYPFNIVQLQEFTKSEILDLIRLLVPDSDHQTIWNQIGEIYDLRDLAKRAILLKMIVKTLPELQKNINKIDSAMLYLVYTQKLLRREIESRKIGLELSEKEKFIGYIAGLMFKNNELIINTQKFDKEIKSFFKNSYYTIDELNNYNYDCKVSTFFSRDYNDNYRFIHKSFYEYYFAFYCIQQLGEDNFDPWEQRWFPIEIARFITELLSNRKYNHLISKLIQISIDAQNEILLWNTLHIVSLIDVKIMEKYLTQYIKQEYIKKGDLESRSIIIRQYCRIIAKFIDKKKAENLIDKIINIVKNDPLENATNDQTYYNYYGGKSAAFQAFIRHLSTNEPKYDAKLHLYLLEHLAPIEYADKIIEVTNKWTERSDYLDEVNKVVKIIKERNTICSA